MLMIACPLIFLVIYAGMKLLAQTQKESLGNMYKYVSWLLIVAGFGMLICCSLCCAMRCCHRGGERMMMKKECRMMQECNSENSCGMRGGNMGCMPMMGNNCAMTHGGCQHMMMNGGCGERMGNCHGMKENCCEQMSGECHKGMKGCEGEDDDECPVKKGECKKDSVRKK